MTLAGRFLCIAAISLAASLGPARAEEPARAPLDSAAAVLSLTAEQAGLRLPVRLSGVVTAAEPDWTGQFFLQDETGGVFVENLGRPQPRPGEVVTVEGVSHPGAFAPIISAPRWTKTGESPLPEARVVSIENLMAGIEDGVRVETSGVVRTARIEDGRLRLDLAVGGYRLEVFAPSGAGGDLPAGLVAARVRVRGTAATHYNAALRHLTSVAVYVPRTEDFLVIAPEQEDPFAQPAIALNRVAQYRRAGEAMGRMHVRGVVTLQRAGESVFVQDATGGLRVHTASAEPVPPGSEVEAVGFLEFENHLPLLRDATLRLTGVTMTPAAARAVPFAEVRVGWHHAELITVRGRILDRTTRPLARVGATAATRATTWFMQGEEMAFTVEYEHVTDADDAAFDAVPLGSVVDVDGVCVSKVDTMGRLQALTLLLPSPGGMRVHERPSWWTPQRLLAGVGLLSAVLVLVASWSLTVSRKNAALRVVVREREQAQRELQEAHDTLEQKVIERSAQLQVEMTARRTAEVQFKAVLAERTRLARDLHDTLEQTLAGIALHLDTAAKLFERTPEKSSYHLQLARSWLQQSQIELRHSIWDLRSRELEQFDLARALRRSAEQLVDGTGITLEFRVDGDMRGLPEVVEENVLRIGQEALTNVAKHARATHIAIELTCEPHRLVLRIEDNGVGIDHARAVEHGESHFGLVGMTERARRMGGVVRVEGSPSRGTRVALEIPLEAACGPAPQAGQADTVNP
ncbi:MAG: hypothetical protein IAE82_15365 [Opitutaceae bacterium]|nr:hypothetical protein [Opitutaceae bacterium]